MASPPYVMIRRRDVYSLKPVWNSVAHSAEFNCAHLRTLARRFVGFKKPLSSCLVQFRLNESDKGHFTLLGHMFKFWRIDLITMIFWGVFTPWCRQITTLARLWLAVLWIAKFYCNYLHVFRPVWHGRLPLSSLINIIPPRQYADSLHVASSQNRSTRQNKIL